MGNAAPLGVVGTTETAIAVVPSVGTMETAIAVVPSVGTTETAIAVMPSVGRVVAVVAVVVVVIVTMVNTDKGGITNPINVTVMDVVVMPNETNIGVATVVMPNLTPGPTTGVVMVVDTA